jgi:alkaline phosphatase
VVDYAQDKGFRYVTNAAELASVGSVKNQPLLGLFAPVNMTTQFAPLIAAPTPGSGAPTSAATSRTARPTSRASAR